MRLMFARAVAGSCLDRIVGDGSNILNPENPVNPV